MDEEIVGVGSFREYLLAHSPTVLILCRMESMPSMYAWKPLLKPAFGDPAGGCQVKA